MLRCKEGSSLEPSASSGDPDATKLTSKDGGGARSRCLVV
jgi:hypothetical protein